MQRNYMLPYIPHNENNLDQHLQKVSFVGFSEKITFVHTQAVVHKELRVFSFLPFLSCSLNK